MGSRAPTQFRHGIRLCAREFLDNRFVYSVISPRARGLSIGINVTPDEHCNFDCHRAPAESRLEVPMMIGELERTLRLAESGGVCERLCYQAAPRELSELRYVALSGGGEPTLCPNFVKAVEAIVHLRARGRFRSLGSC